MRRSTSIGAAPIGVNGLGCASDFAPCYRLGGDDRRRDG
ncbi:hypothetical protein LG3211_0071 [Lysobacter gummosus]|nr:hypothetical protein LG3211_0071 [Lysobacter gummosus]